MRIDLQLHSTYSDGFLTPTELVQFIAKHNIKIASLTDHNTVGGWEEFRAECAKYKIKAIPGIELYVKLGTYKINILWYNFDVNSPELHKILRDSQIRRRALVRRALNKLIQKGFKINANNILDKYTHYTPINYVIQDIIAIPYNRNKVARELKNKNFREDQVIRHYFYNSQICKLSESYIKLKCVLTMRKKIGGQIIFNHPGKHNKLKKNILIGLKKNKIDGIEMLSPHHSIGAVMYIQHIAQEMDWITTGGSDFHCHEGGRNDLQNSLEYFKIYSRYLRKIDKIIG